MLRISNQQARHLILHLQGLTRPHHKAFGDGELAALIEQMGFVQQDTIRWVERAHHMTMFARNRTYRPAHLKKLHESGVLFENWTHDASLIPTKFWKYWKHRFVRNETRLRERFKSWQGEGFERHVAAIYAAIEDKGILRSRDLEKPEGKRLEMWQWHDGKAALEFMWRTGKLAVPKREGFNKTYDLSERVIPAEHFHASCEHDAFVDWACRSALDRLGFGTAKDISAYWEILSLSEVKEWLEVHGWQETVNVSVEPIDGSKPLEFVARPDIAVVLENLAPVPDLMRMLSPFDPVIRDRKRLLWLFGFDYRIEIYVPAEKRKYGYYVFPVLERDRLIGRIDAQARRADDQLHVTRLWLEHKVKWSKSRQNKLQSELTRQARLCGVSQITFADDWI